MAVFAGRGWAAVVGFLRQGERALAHFVGHVTYLSASSTASAVRWSAFDIRCNVRARRVVLESRASHAPRFTRPKRILSLDGGGIRGSYVRYDIELEVDTLRQDGICVEDINSVRDMSVGANAQLHYEIGVAAAKRLCSDAHLPAVFDP